ncbi:MAG: cytochrome c4 [Acetobacteraceae bacterium]|nr:cytochrome c4 [Acetobacteraceae bacterium]
MRAALLLAGLLLTWPALAQDAARGRAIVENGTENAAPCASCHGMDGRANRSEQFPRLDGQSAHYLLKQLEDYASGSRPNEVMTPIAQGLTARQRQDVAAWFAAQDFAAGPEPTGEEARRGRAIYELGIAERGVQACINCHGPGGLGLGPLIPRIVGQWSDYAEAQLHAFREGTRRNDAGGAMRAIAPRLTEADVDALTAWLERDLPSERQHGPRQRR